MIVDFIMIILLCCLLFCILGIIIASIQLYECNISIQRIPKVTEFLKGLSEEDYYKLRDRFEEIVDSRKPITVEYWIYGEDFKFENEFSFWSMRIG